MNKLLRYLTLCVVFLLGLGLTACNNEDTTPVDDNVPTSYLYEHTLSKSNFESFFEISIDFELKDDGTYAIDLLVENLYPLMTEEMNVTFFIYVTERYNQTEEERIYQLNRSNFLTINHTFESTDTAGLTKAFLSEFDLNVFSGNIKTNEIINMDEKSYPITYEEPDDRKRIEILNPVQNQEHYQGFLAILNRFDQIESPHVSYAQVENLYISNPYQSQVFTTSKTLRMMMDPIYIAYETDGFTEIVTRSPNDTLIYFILNPYEMRNNQFIVRPIPFFAEDLDALWQNIEITEQDALLEGYLFDPSSMLFEVLPNGYRVKAMLRDLLDQEIYNELILLYDELGVDSTILDETVINFLAFNLNDIYHFVVEMTIEIDGDIKQTITSRNEYIYDFKSFEPENLDTLDVIVLPPREVLHIFDQTDVLSEVEVFESPGPHVFLAYLEKGQYFMHKSNSEIKIDIYNESLEQIDYGVTYQNGHTGNFRNVFIIEEDGYYILETSTPYNYPSYHFRAEKMQVTSDLTNPTPMVLGNNQLTITDPFHIAYFMFDAEVDMVLEITGEAESLRYIRELLWAPGIYQSEVAFPFGVEKVYWPVKQGSTEFYFTSETPLDIVINVADYGPLKHKSDQLEDMPLLSETFLEDPMLIGMDMGISYVKLEAIHGIYTFEFEQETSVLHPQILLYNADTDELVMRIYTDVHKPVILEAGNYYMSIDAHNVFTFNIRYKVTPYENTIYQERIQTYPSYDISAEDFPLFEGVLNDIYHRPVHRFTLDQPAAVIISTSPMHQLFDEAGNLLTFRHLIFSHSRIIYYLDAGTYDLTPILTDDRYILVDYKIKIAIIDDEIDQDNYYPKEPAEFLYEGGTMQFNDDHWYDYEVIKMVITENVTYTLRGSKHFNVYDEALNQLHMFSAENSKSVSFEPGIYYLVTHRFPVGDFRLIIWPPVYDQE